MVSDRKTYNVKEVAALLGISIPAAYSLAAREDFPSIRIGERRIVIPMTAFDEWLDKQANKAIAR